MGNLKHSVWGCTCKAKNVKKCKEMINTEVMDMVTLDKRQMRFWLGQDI